MSDIKCPICGKQMKIGTLDTDDGIGTVWMSIMPCDCVCSYGASKAVWQELIRTRKALKIARSGLIDIFGYEGVPKYVAKHVRQVLDQSKIETALEQKDK